MNEVFIRSRIHEITEGGKHKLGEDRVYMYRSIHNSSAPQNWTRVACRGKTLRSRSWGCLWECGSSSNCECQRREAAFAESKKPFATRGLGERRKLPQRGLGRSPRNRTDFEHFMPKLGPFWDLVNLRFFSNQMEKNSRLKKFLLTRSWIYETTIML